MRSTRVVRGGWWAVRLPWRLGRRAARARRSAGGFVGRTALRYRARAAGLAALALLAGIAAAEAGGTVRTVAVVVCLGLSLAAWRSWRLAGRFRAGAASERAVADRLRPLELEGWLVLHDLEKPRRGNVDHVAAGPGGAFTIETKTARYTAADLEQAFGHARWAERRLRLPVTPVLCLARRREPPSVSRGVVVVGARELPDFLAREPRGPVDPARVARRLR